MKKVTRIQAAYIAGLFDGEGSIASSLTWKRRRGIRIAISQKNPKVLQYIYQTLGVGHLHRSHKGIYYKYYIGKKKDVLDFIQLIQPYCIVKKEKLKVGKKLALLTQKIGTNKISNKLHFARRELTKQLRDTPNA